MNIIPGVPISIEEAEKIASEQNGIISGGGYTFLPGFYCGQGTAPGCFRGGDTTSILGLYPTQWYRLTLRDLIVRTGFYPCPFFTAILTRLQSDFNDYSINIDDMVKFCIDGPHTAEQLKRDGDIGNSKIWSAYFNDVDKRTNKRGPHA